MVIVLAGLFAAFAGSHGGLGYGVNGDTAARSFVQTAPSCLHDRATETPDQLARRRQAIGLARTVNSAEAAYSAQHGGAYAPLADLIAANFVRQPPASGEHVPGFQLHLDAMPQGYWFEVVDSTDSCGFRLISNQKGLIFEAQPLQ